MSLLLPTWKGTSPVLNRDDITVQWDRNWSRGLVLHVLAREKLERNYFLLSEQTSVGKYFLKIMAKVDTSPLLASSKKRQNVT